MEAPWKRQTAAERSSYVTFHRFPGRLSDKRQQIAAPARAYKQEVARSSRAPPISTSPLSKRKRPLSQQPNRMGESGA